jgi:glutathione S-transferase
MHRTGTMSEDLVLYTHPMSRGRIARWMLEEVGQPYWAEILTFDASMKSANYLALNPMGKVPAISHKGTIVTECGAICAYLADAFPEVKLAPPPGSPARGSYYRWMFFAAGPVEAGVTNKALGFEVPAGRERMAGYGRYGDVMNTLEFAVTQNEFIAGDQFTAADVYFGSQIGAGLAFKTIEPRPAFQAYWQRLADRPAALRAREIDDSLIAEMKKAQSAH